jgi:hypothetical protein
MHMLAKQGQKSDIAESLSECDLDLNKHNHEQLEARYKLAAQEQQRHVPVDVKNR